MSRRRAKLRKVWRVVVELGDGRRPSHCGHKHRTSMAAVRCPYEPCSYKRDPYAGLFIVAVWA